MYQIMPYIITVESIEFVGVHFHWLPNFYIFVGYNYLGVLGVARFILNVSLYEWKKWEKWKPFYHSYRM